MSIEQQFEEAMREACSRSAEASYYPARFLQKMERYGAVPYAKELVVSGDLQSGLRRLQTLGLLGLSIEHLVAKTAKFAPLFTPHERAAAEWRLNQQLPQK